MESRVRILGHGAHPILIVFPLGLLTTSLIFDVARIMSDNSQWAFAAYWMIAAGVVGGLVAAVPGLMDWLSIPAGTRAKKIGLFHAVTNVIVLMLFAIGWWMRRSMPEYVPDVSAVALSAIAVVLAMVGGWLGGELVERLGVSVHPDAHLNAPSSLS